MRVDPTLRACDLVPSLARMFQLAGDKVRLIERTWDPTRGTPVFTIEGRYVSRGWTEWTQGFQYGSSLLVYDATGEREFLDLGRERTMRSMAAHLTHTGVHDHGFNNVSTYGNLRRLMLEGRIERDPWELACYEMALKVSGAVQAARWAPSADGLGYIYSFNGPHSLFVDTLRSLRSLALAHKLGHVLMGENDIKIDLLERLIQHALCTARHIVYRGQTGQPYDVRGRTAHEAIFNRNDGRFRCRSTQQGYSPFSTWTRGLAWALLGYAEQLEFLEQTPDDKFALPAIQAFLEREQPKNSDRSPLSGSEVKAKILAMFEAVAIDLAEHYLRDATALDGIPYWDDGAPGLARLGAWRERSADPYNDEEPVDSSAAAIAAQGLIRLGRRLGPRDAGREYEAAGYGVAKTLLAEPYLSVDSQHQGLLLHSVYHRPNGWDHVPPGRRIPCGESSMWGDYHLLELGVLIQRLANHRDLRFAEPR